ncbi:MAG: hypothetical protein QM726_12790 [Chitinophagaceae bacterium]
MDFNKLHLIPKQNIKIGINEYSTFYFVNKKFEFDSPIYVIFIKTISFDKSAHYEYLHAEFIISPNYELKDFDKPYYDECTHLLVSEIIPFDDSMAKIWTNAFATYLKSEYNWLYPITDPYSTE